MARSTRTIRTYCYRGENSEITREQKFAKKFVDCKKCVSE